MTKKARIVENLSSLTDTEKQNIIDFFNQHPHFEGLIDWNNKTLQYKDFEKVFVAAKESRKNVKRQAQKNPRILFEKYNCRIIAQTDEFLIVMPLDQECAVFFNSFKCGGSGAKWCIGDKNTARHWNNYIREKMVFYFVYFIREHPVCGKKLAVQYNMKKKKLTTWLADDTGLPGVRREFGLMEIERILREETKSLEEKALPKICEFLVKNGCLKRYDGNGEAIAIPENVTAIGSLAFSLCSDITEVILPGKIVSIGVNPFVGCKRIKKINVEKTNIAYCDIDGVLFDKPMHSLISCPAGRIESYAIPDIAVIKELAFVDCKELTEVILPKSLTTVENGAFQYCRKLEAITIPEHVCSIESNFVFYGCTALTAITVDPANTAYRDIDGVLFDKQVSTLIAFPARKKGRYTIPESVVSIAPGAFADCTGPKLVPKSVTSIGHNAFHGCTGIAEIELPAGTTAIAKGEFKGCTGLRKISIPEGVTVIGDSAFESCKRLSVMVIPEGVTSIGDRAFSECAGLQSITIPESVTSIGKGAFYHCTGLTSIVIPVNITSIGDYTFSGCENLRSVTIPEGVTVISERAFRNCKELSSIVIPQTVTSIGDLAFHGCAGLTSIVMPVNITSVSDAFVGCRNLTSIAIPEGFTALHCISPFRETVETISVDKNNTSYCDIDGVVFNKEKTVLLRCPKGKKGEYRIPESVTAIGCRAFEDCTKLTSVIMPEGVTAIDDWAFYGCTGLTSITIPENVTAIGWWAFRDCTGLISVVMPEKITTIDRSTFYGCTGLTSITIPKNVTGIGDFAFRDCRGLKSIIIPESVAAIGHDAFRDCSELSSVVIPEKVTIIKHRTFSGCTGLKSLTLPESITAIGECAFKDCRRLISATIPEKVTVIKRSTFSGCRELTSVVMPKSVTAIGSNAFRDCERLTEIAIPEGAVIGCKAFNGCTGLDAKICWKQGSLWP